MDDRKWLALGQRRHGWREDRSTVHADNGPKIMAALRNTALSLLRRAGVSTIAARLRYNSGHPRAALQLLSLSLA